MLTLLQIPGWFFSPKMLFSVWGGLCGQLFRNKALHSPTLIASSRGIMVPKLPPLPSYFSLFGHRRFADMLLPCLQPCGWGLCSKDQDSEFLFLFLYCLSLGAFPRSWELCRRMDVSPGSTHVHSSAKSHCNGTSMKHGHGTGNVGLLLYFSLVAGIQLVSHRENSEAAVGHSMGSLEVHW